MKKKDKNNLPVFDSDDDLLEAFENNNKCESGDREESVVHSGKDIQKNKHGINMLQDSESERQSKEHLIEENFEALLEASFKKQSSKSVKKSSPMPVKKRIKRYPPVEIELDLHGFNAVGAQVKARSFIHSCKQRGYFTLRIIVGKGLHSELGPVLPDIVEDVLKEMMKQNLVIGYDWDKKMKSKSGSVVVYLKHFERFE